MSVRDRKAVFPPNWSSAEVAAVHSLIAMTGAFYHDEANWSTGKHAPTTGKRSSATKAFSSHTGGDQQALVRPRRDRRPPSTYSSADYDLSTANMPLPPKYPAAARSHTEPRAPPPPVTGPRTHVGLKRPQPEPTSQFAPVLKKPVHSYTANPIKPGSSSDDATSSAAAAANRGPDLAPLHCPGGSMNQGPAHQTISNASSGTAFDSDHSPTTPHQADPLLPHQPKDASSQEHSLPALLHLRNQHSLATGSSISSSAGGCLPCTSLAPVC